MLSGASELIYHLVQSLKQKRNSQIMWHIWNFWGKAMLKAENEFKKIFQNPIMDFEKNGRGNCKMCIFHNYHEKLSTVYWIAIYSLKILDIE